MGESIHTFTPVNQAEWALYIEGQRCPFTMLQLSYGENLLPMLAGTIPASEYTDSQGTTFSIRNIPPNAKVVVMYRNSLMNASVPRFEVRFVGEITSPGFTRNASEKNYQFRAQHITYNLKGISLSALEPAAYLQEVIEGRPAEGSNLQEIIIGTIFEAFSPRVVAEGSKIPFEKQTIHDFTKESLKVYMARALKGATKQAHPIQAAVNYGLFEHLYTSSDDDTRMLWGRLYSIIMHYTYMDLIPKISGSRISYLEMIQSLCQLFLQNLDVDPSPKHYNKTMIVKPDTVFLPPPACNVIYPIFATNYEYRENWDQKPTRLIQIQHPASGVEAAQLRTYYRTVSPPALRALFKAYQEAGSAEEREAMDLTTQEEKLRPIVESFNELPSFISAAIMAVENGERTNEAAPTGTGARTVDGKASELSGGVTTAASIDYSASMVVDEAKRKKIFCKAFLHEELLKIELGKSTIDLASFNTGGGKALSGKNKYVPRYIYLIDEATAYSGGRNYEVEENGAVTMKAGRHFHIFQEPSGLPLAIKFLRTKSEIVEAKAARNPAFPDPFVYLDKDVSIATTPLSTNPLSTSTDERPSLDSLKNSVSGGTHWSVVIVAPLSKATPDSDEALARLLAIITTMCGMSSSDILTLSSEYGDTFSAKGGQGVTVITGEAVLAKMRTKVALAQPKLEADMDKAFQDYLKQIGAEEKAPPPATTTTEKGKTKDPVGQIPIVPNWRVHIPKEAYNKLQQEQQASAQTPAEPTPSTPSNGYQNLLRYPRINSALLNSFIKKANAFTPTTYIWKALVLFVSTAKSGVVANGRTDVGKVMDAAVDNAAGFLKEEMNKKTTLGNLINGDTNLKILMLLIGLISVLKNGNNARLKLFVKDIQAIGKDATASSVVNKVLVNYSVENSILSDFMGTYRTQFTPEAAALSDSQFINLQGLLGIVDPILEKAKAAQGTPQTTVTPATPIEEQTELDEKKIKFDTLQRKYIEPICDYYFYKNRHASSTSEIQMPFHPYITPGYSCIVVDGSGMQMHQYGYVNTVTHTILPDAAWTTASLAYLRRADEELWREYEYTAIPVDAQKNFPISPVEVVSNSIPFFQGEWSLEVGNNNKVRLDATYEKLLGCKMAEVGSVVNVANSAPDYLTAIRACKRDTQTAQAIIPQSNAANEVYKSIYQQSPSKIQFTWNDYALPQQIDMVTGVLQPSDYVTGATSRTHGDKFAWNAGVQAIIKLLWNKSITKGAYRG